MKEQEHTLLLHIGVPKTGTSALQRFLCCNTEVLKQYGWEYPDLDVILGNTESFFIEYANATVLYKKERVLDFCSENWIRAWNFIKKELRNYNVILSAEHIFEWHDEENILTEIVKECRNVKVIVYLRRQDVFLESFWSQLVKSDNWDKGFEESMPELLQYVQYLDSLNRIERIIGKENLIVRVYEKKKLKGDRQDICSDFLDAIGVKPDWTQFCEVGRINETLFGNYLEIKRIFNSLQEIHDISPQVYKQFFLNLSHALSEEKKVMGFFREKEREKFLSQFYEENKVIAEQFVHDRNGVLFYDMNTEVPFSEVRATEFEEALIRLFGTIIHETRNRVDFLERNARKSTEILINIQRNGRKIVYFGGGRKCKELLQTYRWNVEMVIDNDKEKSGCQINGIPIVSPLNISNWEELFIIVTCIDTVEISEQLEAMGLIGGKDFVLAREFLY